MEKPGVWVHLWMLLFIQTALWTVPCFSADLGQNCTNDNCTVANSACIVTENTCACEAKYYQFNVTTCLERLAPGAGCNSSSDQCVGNATCGDGADAGSSTCHCDSDFYPDGQKCSQRLAPGAGCNSSSDQCVRNATCVDGAGSSTCHCDSDFYPDGQKCSQRLKPGDECNSTNQCVGNAKCSTTCRCYSDFYPNGQQCSQKTKLNEQCNASLPNICQTDTTCVDDGQGVNKCRLNYGSDCTVDNECQETLNQKCLPYSTDSQKKKCLCSTGFFRQNTSNSCTNVNILEVKNLTRDGDVMETSVAVSWTKPNELGQGYAEYSASLTNLSQWSAWSNDTNASFSSLMQGKSYQIVVYLRTKKDPNHGNVWENGTTPQELSVLTKPGKPGGLISGTYSVPNVTLKFLPSNGTVNSYTVTVTPGRDSQTVQGGAKLEVTFTNLKADRTYNVTIVAISNGITSVEWTASFYVDAARAGKVTNLTVADTGSRWSLVKWLKPSQPNGVIKRYTVRVFSTVNSELVCESVLCSNCTYNASDEPTVADCRNKDSNTTQTGSDLDSQQVNVTRLKPDVSYTVHVNAYNQKGKGVDSNTAVTTKQEAAPPLTNLTLMTPGERQLNVTWVPGERTGPTNYTVTWMERERMFSGTFRDIGSVIVVGYANTQHLINEELLSYWEYKVSVAPFTPVEPPTGNVTRIRRTISTKPAEVSFNITQLENSAEKVTLIVQCPEEKKRNGRITAISYSVEVKQQGAYVKNVPGDSISVSDSQCWGSKEVDVAAEATYVFSFFAKTSSLDGSNSSSKEIKINPQRPKLDKPQGVSSLVEAGESQTSTVTLQVCSCVASPRQGRVKLAGIIACVKSSTDKCQPASDVQLKTKYEGFRTWKQFIEGGQQGRFRATGNGFLQEKRTRRSLSGRVKRSDTKFVPFTLGENKSCEQQGKDEFCNGPLPEDQEFVVIVWACTEAGCSEAEGVTVKTLAGQDSPVGAIVGAVVAVVVIAAIVAVVAVVVLRRKKKLCFNAYGHPEPNGVLRPTRERRAVKLIDFAAHLESLHKDSNLLFQDEFEEIQGKSPGHPQEASLLDANKVKNRYVNILPFDHTRVKLSTDDDDDTMNFINANYIPGYSSPREYIATQGPMVGTCAHFWTMLWEQKSSLIVMLSDLQEKGRPKVDQYWPGEVHSPVQYEDIVVELTSASTLNKYTIRTFSVYKEDHKEETRHVAQYFIPGWEDYSANLNPDDVLDFIASTRQEARSSQGPIIVHCSAGVGRTGTFIALDFLMQYVQEHRLDDTVDIYNLVLNMRHNRAYMVQSEKQYIFIHDTLKVIIDRKISDEEEHVYGNTSLDDIYVNQAFEPEENLYENTGSRPTTSL
ncbi:hypothetical protein ACOMHN_059744 [Nucella lapillus]